MAMTTALRLISSASLCIALSAATAADTPQRASTWWEKDLIQWTQQLTNIEERTR